MRNILFSTRVWWLSLLILTNVSGSFGAESKVLRVAVGPYFAPVGNDYLRQASQSFPELLLAELSHMPRFQMVEREKVQSVWSELNLTASGLVARDTVAKLGHVLSCDWLVSGSFVQVGGRTHVWTKVIDVRSGVVLDLNVAPYESGVITNTIVGIAAFLEKAGTKPEGRQFIAMGPFVDMNPELAPKRDDWSRRIPALIEKHFLEVGFGVAEIAAVGPIFEERRLETAGLTGHPEGRVKLQAAFWLVDGGCEWVESAPGKISVGLRIQKIGGPEQIIRLTEAAGEEIERAIIATVSRTLANTNLVASATPNAEADLLAARGMELATRRSPFQPRISPTKTQWDSYKQQLEQRKQGLDNRNASIATYERTVLRDPKNLEAKTMLGAALLSDPEPARRERGKALLRELAESDDTKYARAGKAYLARAEALAHTGDQMAVSPKRPDDWLSLNQAVAENPNDMEAKCDLGAAMLTLPRASSREQGRKLLAEVVAGDRQDQAERARRILAEPEKTPAIPDQTVVPTIVTKPVVSAPPTLEPEENEERKRREFFQEQFEKFIPVRFERDGPQLAKLQRLPVTSNMFDYQGRHYCGFSFTTPEWLDGDLQWMHILAKTEVQKDFSTADFEWYIVPKSGRMKGFRNFSRLSVSNYPQLKQRFPHTQTMFLQGLPKDYLEPGKEYAIWFGFKDADLPDIAYALTIRSQRGYAQFGTLPLE
ncbi:MAG: hypothetical protein HOP33_03300 [Verrucomicrobia bacterium]|nr:hypothetical protein [Verrucomicrobiota bacterium]